jgi:hypothetical protein
MKTASQLTSNPPTTSLFELAARMDVSAPASPPQTTPGVSEATFATLRQEAEQATAPVEPAKRPEAWSNARLTFPMDTIRAAAIRRTLQRKLEANEVFRPEF